MAFVLTVMGWLGETLIKNLIDKVQDEMKNLGSQSGEGGECEVGDALSDLQITLTKMQPFISKAENTLIKDENFRQNVNKLLVLLRDAAYDAEDLLDKFQFQKVQQQIEQQDSPCSENFSPAFKGQDHNQKETTKRRSTRRKWTNSVMLVAGGYEGPIDDGYSWRKYGQKVFRGAKHPISYYKCENKRGCPARKRVQRSDNDPLLFEVTYDGTHSCLQEPQQGAASAQHKPLESRGANDGLQKQQNPNQLLSFQTGVKVKTEGPESEEAQGQASSSPSFASMAAREETLAVADFFSSPTFLSPVTSESTYFSIPRHRISSFEGGIKQQGNEACAALSLTSLSFPSHPMKKRKVGEDNDNDDVTKIRKIQEKLDNIISVAVEKLLSSDDRGKMQMVNEMNNRVTGSIPVEIQVFGRDNQLNELIRLLLEPHQGGSGFGSSSNISILTISGMGGVGKTTLAQEAYNDKRVEEFFKLKIWVCVSEDFSAERLTKEIIESATKQKCDLSNFNSLQAVLKEEIISKKFLIVLDDVWNEDKHKWDSLCAPLKAGVIGSKILITTRNVRITDMVGSVNPIHLDSLDGDNSWAFFKKCVFGSQDSRDYPQLEAIAKEMVPKLKGLPLAVRTLGGLLNMNMNEQHWKTIMDSEIWKLPQEEHGVLLVLQLSYQYLPAHLKRCFAFSSLYPKDYQFDEHELVRIWMAEGFLPVHQNITMEDFGSGCFQELVSRSFFQKSQRPNRYVMHDLMHDLAQLISEGETYRLEDGKPFEIPTTICHLNTVSMEDNEVLRRIIEFRAFNKLRTLIYPRQYSSMNSILTSGFLNRLQSVRTLILRNCGLTEFPESIGVFIHLRYLNISGNSKITKLPSSLFKLYNLLVLILESCGLHELPESIGNLFYLRYLDISWNENLNKLPKSLCCLSNLQTLNLNHCHLLWSLPQGMSKLINLRKLDAEENLVSKIIGIGKLRYLQSLSIFKVGKEHGRKLAELSGLTQLHGTLRITSLENSESKEEAITAKLQSKLHLDELVLQWTSDQKNDAFSDSEEEVLEHLQPNSTLKRLMISGYSGSDAGAT